MEHGITLFVNKDGEGNWKLYLAPGVSGAKIEYAQFHEFLSKVCRAVEELNAETDNDGEEDEYEYI